MTENAPGTAPGTARRTTPATAPATTPGATVAGPEEEPSIGQLVASASRDVSTLIRHEIALAKSEVKVSVKAGGIGAADLYHLFIQRHKERRHEPQHPDGYQPFESQG